MINNIDVNERVVSNKLPIGNQDFKYFIGYKDAKKIKPLCIFHPRMSIYKRDFSKIKCIFWQKMTGDTTGCFWDR